MASSAAECKPHRAATRNVLYSPSMPDFLPLVLIRFMHQHQPRRKLRPILMVVQHRHQLYLFQGRGSLLFDSSLALA